MNTNQLIIKEGIATCFTALGRYDKALSAYGAEKKNIDTSMWNDEEKARLRSKAREAVAEAAQRCHANVAKELETIRKTALTMESEFAITPELTAAIAFVSAVGKNLPWESRQNTVKAFVGSKQALLMLAALFEAHDVDAKEVKGFIFDAAGQCDKLDDAAYSLMAQPGVSLGAAYNFAKALEEFARLEGVELSAPFISENEAEYLTARMRESMGLPT